MLTETQRGYAKLGAICAFGGGICYGILTLLAFVIPSSIASYVASPEYFEDFKHIKALFLSLKTIHSFANLAMIGVVLSFLSLCRDRYRAIVTWSSCLAIIGYAVGLFQNIEDMQIIPKLASQYNLNNSYLQETIIAFGVANPYIFLLSLGLPGLWFIVVSSIGLSHSKLPKALVVLGLFWGFGNIVTAIAHAFVLLPIIYIVAVGALLCAPLWGFLEAQFLFSLLDDTTQ